MGRKTNINVGERVAVNDFYKLQDTAGILPMVGTVDRVTERMDGACHRGWNVHLRDDLFPRYDGDQHVIWPAEKVYRIWTYQRPPMGLIQPQKSSFPIGSRVAVVDETIIATQTSKMLMVGWVKSVEKRVVNSTFSGWNYIIQESRLDVTCTWYEGVLSKVPLTLFGKLIHSNHSAYCPWCSEYGRDPRWTDWYYGGQHPPIEDCTCWWHFHKRHMANCPY